MSSEPVSLLDITASFAPPPTLAAVAEKLLGQEITPEWLATPENRRLRVEFLALLYDAHPEAVTQILFPFPKLVGKAPAKIDDALQAPFFTDKKLPADFPQEAMRRSFSVEQYFPEALPEVHSQSEEVFKLMDDTARLAAAQQPSALTQPAGSFEMVDAFVDQTARYGVFFRYESGVTSALFNDYTLIFHIGDIFRYYTNKKQMLDIPKQMVPQQVHDIEKKCRLISQFEQDLLRMPRSLVDGPTYHLPVQLFRVQSAYSWMLFQDLSFEIFFGDMKWHVDCARKAISLLSSRQRKVTVGASVQELANYDPDCAAHLMVCREVLLYLRRCIVTSQN